MKKTVSTLVIIAILVTAQQASAESWLSKTFGPNGSAFKMLGASVMNITSVDSVQKKLIDAGALKGVATGVADEQTVNAVKTFQATNNLKVDGVVGKETLKVLDPVVAAGGTFPIGAKPTPTKIDAFKLLCLDGKPHVQVVSPNGGEVFSAGQQITVNWKSCNLPATTFTNPIMITLEYGNFQANASLLGLIPSIGTQNTGSAAFTLPPASSFSPGNYQYGNNYKIVVKYMYVGSNIDDRSDNWFTINGNQASSSPILLKPLDSVMLYAGDAESTPTNKAGIFNPSHLVSLKNTSNQTLWIGCNAVGSAIEFTGSVLASSNANTLICTNSLGASLFNDDQIPLAPNQEIILNQATAILITRDSQSGIATLKSVIDFVNYRLVQNGPVIQGNPQSHPQFQSSWVPKMSTAWVLY